VNDLARGHSRPLPGAVGTTASRRQQETRSFGTTRAELESLGDWLACWGVTRAGMEATGDYWKPAFFVLESRGFDCQLYNAGQVKAAPPRSREPKSCSKTGT
jgi:transposase